MARSTRRQDGQLRRSRPILALVGAALLPVIIFVAVQAFVIFSDERRGIEDMAMERAQQIMSRVDGEIESDQRALRAFAQLIPDPGAYRPANGGGMRSRMFNEIFPNWAGFIMWRIGEPAARYNTLRAQDETPLAEETWPDLVKPNGEAVVDGVRMVGKGVVALLHDPIVNPNNPGFVLTLAVKPQTFQDIMLSELPAATIGAIVDREGRFVARSVNYEQRVGTPATQVLRDAVHSGQQKGFYRGKTYEGFENYTAFYVSPKTGWSAHVAISRSLVDAPRSWSLAIAVIGGLMCLALSGGLLFLVAQDNAERRKQDNMLMQAQKMESLGQLTGGIAHDFNNLLTVIIGNLEKLKRKLSDPELQTAADGALASSRRAAGLTQGLLAYARRQSLLPRVLNVNELAASMSEIMARTLGENVKVRTELAGDIWMTEVDENQLGSAILNLGVNARDAMPEGGTITVSTRNQNLAREAKDLSLKPGDYVVLTVSDTGQGMPADVAAKAFEPFFTTKGVGQGTGLGLSQVYGFMRQSGGTAVIVSKPGQGAAIQLYLPRSFAEPSADETAQNKPAQAAPQGLKVLLVEDDAAVRAHGRELLAELGHSVVEAATAHEALGAMSTKGPFDLLFTDIVLPGGTSGLDLQREVRRTHRGLKVLLATGYAGGEFEEAKAPGNVLLAKPYARDDLEKKIAEAMHQAAPAAEAVAAAQSPSSAAGRPAVLLVEDEVLIRMLGVDTLSDGGFDVIEAGSSAQAIARMTADASGAIRVAVVDLGLPDGPGEALVAELQRLRPGLPVVIASGQGARKPVGDLPLLSKPYDPAALLAAVRKLTGK